jgi:hypothetical protein
MISRTGNDTVIEHALYTLMDSGSGDTALLRYIPERDTGIA